jgi:hypothetical protein
MVTITYDALNDLVHEIADAIVKTTGIPKETFDLFRMNDDVTAYLSAYGVQYEEGAPAYEEPDEATRERLEYLRGEIRAERISYGDLFELQSLAEFIHPSDAELLEWAGVPEFPDEEPDTDQEFDDWKYEVANGDTLLGYEEWRQHQKEANV